MTNAFLTATAAAEIPADGSAPDWIELMPVGPMTLGDGRGPFRIREAAAVIARSLEDATGKVLPIDRDHGMDKEGGDGGAYGWITAMELRGDAVWARVEWTEEGAALVESRKYRFISPTFLHTKANEVVRFLRAALTNNPAIATMKALAHLENSMNEELKALAAALGLGEDADEKTVLEKAAASVVAASKTETALKPVLAAAGLTGALNGDKATAIAAKLSATGAPDPAKFVARAAFDEMSTQLADLQKQVNGGAVDQAIAEAKRAGKLSPAMEGWAKELAAKDMASFRAWEKTAPVLASSQLALTGAPDDKNETLTDEQKAICAQMGVSEEDFLKQAKGEAA